MICDVILFVVNLVVLVLPFGFLLLFVLGLVFVPFTVVTMAKVRRNYSFHNCPEDTLNMYFDDPLGSGCISYVFRGEKMLRFSFDRSLPFEKRLLYLHIFLNHWFFND